MECVAACPVKDALAISASRRRRLPAWAMAAGIAALFLGVVGYARLNGLWHTEVDPSVYLEIIPRAADLAHPR